MVKAFEFGRNWKRFVAGCLSDERIGYAQESLKNFLKIETLDGKTFLDIGCGSGLFSLAAHRLRAGRITSFDIDENSVGCCRYLYEREGEPQQWKVTTGSILDKAFLQELGQFDVVYSWGVLHHTGSMWQAIENAASLVKKGGVLYIAIYNTAVSFGPHDDGRIGSSRFWRRVKRLYCSLPSPIQRLADFAAAGMYCLLSLVQGKNPFKAMRVHEKNFRGMSWFVDMRDWLGGYPYESATVAEVFSFLHSRGFNLENVTCNNGLRNNEFLFVRT